MDKFSTFIASSQKTKLINRIKAAGFTHNHKGSSVNFWLTPRTNGKINYGALEKASKINSISAKLRGFVTERTAKQLNDFLDKLEKNNEL